MGQWGDGRSDLAIVGANGRSPLRFTPYGDC